MKKGFIKGPPDQYGESKIVNLDQVTNIAFEESIDRFENPKFKIIYNFAYPISLKNNIDKQIPDYSYHVYSNKEEYQEQVEKLNLQLDNKGWYAPIINNKVQRIVNLDYVSFISTDTYKNRIITNLSCSVSFYNDYHRKTSDFIFFDFESLDRLESEILYLEDLLGVE